MAKVKKDVKEFTVKRKNWYRGKGSDESCLITADNKKCCLGFYALSCGLKKSDILKVRTPGEVDLSDKKWITFLLEVGTDSVECDEAMEINDDQNISDKKREKLLKKLFKNQGIKIKFKG